VHCICPLLTQCGHLKCLAACSRSLAFLPACTAPFLEDDSISRYAIDGHILVVVRARKEDCFVIYPSPVFRPAERPAGTVSSPITRFEIYPKRLLTACVVGKLAFQIEHFSPRRHTRNCYGRCARKEKSVCASHSLLTKCKRGRPSKTNFYINCMALKPLGGHFCVTHGLPSGVKPIRCRQPRKTPVQKKWFDKCRGRRRTSW